MSTTGSSLYLRQQFSALLGNTSSSIKFICISTLIGYGLSFSDRAVEILSVTPGYLMPPTFWIWTIFTFCFLEMHFWEVLVDLVTVGLCGKLIEPSWGQMEMLQYFAITNVGVAILTSFYYLFYSMITKDAELLFDVHIHGLAGMNAAVSVAVTQIMPDHLIARTPLGKFTNRNVPLTVVVASIIMWALGLLDGTYPAMFASGLYVSWVYLRFYQRHTNGTRGDSAENFRFASFFPNVLQPFIALVANPVYQGCLRIGLVKRLSPASSSSGSSLQSVSVHSGMVSVDPHDMERRRQIALKALSERLSKSTDSSRQNLLPKSFPQGTGKHNHSHHHHHHHHQGGFPLTMDRPAIPLPAPPSKSALKSDPTSKPTTIPAATAASSGSSSTTNLINLEATEQVTGTTTTTTQAQTTTNT